MVGKSDITNHGIIVPRLSQGRLVETLTNNKNGCIRQIGGRVVLTSTIPSHTSMVFLKP